MHKLFGLKELYHLSYMTKNLLIFLAMKFLMQRSIMHWEDLIYNLARSMTYTFTETTCHIFS